MFKIIKKGNGNFWHNFNNGSKEVNLSNWEIVLDSINQTVSLQMLNGANVPINSVAIADVIVIDETDVSLEETFGSVSALRTRLIELNYTPYIVLNGFVPEAPIDGLTYGRKDAEWVEVSGGGSAGTLQEVTDNGNTTTNDITAGGFLSLGNANIPGINFNDAEDLDTSLGFLGADPSITTPRNWVLPDTSGTIALTSDIPTVITPETGVYYFNDLFGAMGTASDGFIATRSAGSNANVFFNTGTIPNHQVNQSGVAQLKTGTTAGGYAGIHIGDPVYYPTLVVGGGVISYKTSINIETLSNSSERFWVGVGYNNGLFINPGLANAICFIYDEGGVITGNTSSPNWKIVTCNSSVRTFTDTGVAVSAGAWVKLEILINAAATSVEFFINNVSVGTISTNIPSGISKLMIINNQILKTIGTTSRNLYMDYVAYKQTFTTPRI